MDESLTINGNVDVERQSSYGLGLNNVLTQRLLEHETCCLSSDGDVVKDWPFDICYDEGILRLIVDARNPLFFRSTDLEKYVNEGDARKINLPLVNKADMLTEFQRLKWAEYFDANNIRYVFFSAALAKEEAERLALEEANEWGNDMEIDQGTHHNNHSSRHPPSTDDGDTSGEDSVGPHNADADTSDVINNEEDEYITTDDEGDDGEKGASIHIPEYREGKQGYPPGHILSATELLDLFAEECPEPLRTDMADKVTIGFVGYPNVGKSSTLNALVGAKKVAVAATPGKTKHFQTIHISDSVILCDCPGLVFPSFATTKAEMVINGVLPIDQLREHTAPTTLITRHIPKHVFEGVYGIGIKTLNEEGIPVDRNATSEELLKSLAAARGFTKAGQGNPDEARAARFVLKDFVNGKLLYVVPPPGLKNVLAFAKETEVVMLQRVKRRNDNSNNLDHIVPQDSILEAISSESQSQTSPALYTSTFEDDSTSTLASVSAKSMGKFATSNFIRGSLAAPVSSPNSNSKKHGKANKRQGKRRERWTKDI
ncbi:hypothetical protein SeMB42_g01043 [Synchytrium endobioticum]|uniref:G domain-containing protein n=1 Tax=Synchytrium endobioticum TaxID=286115 RepID=A0A507DMU5_9FUNG|nr:hypothetical protein SeMB42_g01043 [Synchytrium endobioticum]